MLVESINKKDINIPRYEVYEYSPKSKDYVLLIPIINEGQRIIDELTKAKNADVSNYVDIVICDGDSKDGCTDNLKELGVNTLLIKRDTGKQSAQLKMGYYWALERGYKGFLTIDGNNKDSIEDVYKLVEKLKEGYGYVQGSRYVEGGKAINTPLIRTLALKLINEPVMSFCAKKHLTDTTNGYRGYSKEFLTDERVKPFRDIFEGYELIYYLPIRACELGYKISEIGVRREYPVGKVPTKINGIKGNIYQLQILKNCILRKYNPNK